MANPSQAFRSCAGSHSLHNAASHNIHFYNFVLLHRTDETVVTVRQDEQPLRKASGRDVPNDVALRGSEDDQFIAATLGNPDLCSVGSELHPRRAIAITVRKTGYRIKP